LGEHISLKRLWSGLRNLTPATRQAGLLVRVVGIVTGLACLGHLVLGANPIVVCICGLTVIFSIYPIAIYGFLDIGAVLVALVGFRYVGFPLLAKLIMGQPLDSNLMEPMVSFLVVFLGLLGYLLALFTSKHFSVGRPTLQFTDSKSVLGRISFLAAIVGLTANLAVAIKAGEAYEGLTIAEFFISFLHLALICAIAMVLISSKRKYIAHAWVVVLVILEITFAMIQNSRIILMDTFMCFVVTIVAFEVKIRWKQIAVTAVVLGAMVIFITPIFLYVRDSRDNLSWTQRIDATLKMVLNWHEAFAYYQKNRELTNQMGWCLNYYGSPRNVFQRMTLVNHVDVLTAGAGTYGTVGSEDLSLSFVRAMPRVLSPNKPVDFGHGSWLYEKIGLFNLGPFATAPLIGTGYVAFGWIGALFYPFLFGFLCFLMIKKISGWDLQSNVWAIYLLIRIHDQFVEGSSDAYILYILRSLPQDFVLLWVIDAVAMGRFLYPRYRKIAPYYGE
jgi:hypothetical protein